MSQQQAPSWNGHFHRDQAYDTTYNNNNNSPMEEQTRLSYFPYKQERGYGDVENPAHNNPGDPSFWKTPGSEQANVMPSAPLPPPESLYGTNLSGREGEEAKNDEELARRIFKEEQENYIRYSQGQPSGEAGSFYGGGDPTMQAGAQGTPPTNTTSLYDSKKTPKAYLDPNVQRQLLKKKLWRPYFTYLVTLVQTVLLIYEFVYNRKETGSVIQTNPLNILIGPSPITLIRLGSRFGPCMRPVPIISPEMKFPCPNTINEGGCTLEEFCGLGGFNNGNPNQWFRFITPIFLHGGVLHFLFNMMFQIQTGRQVEADMGCFRYGIIYMASGIFGFIFGGNFSNLTLPSVGASGSLFGIIGVLLIDLLQNWKLITNPCRELTKLLLMIAFTFLLGLLPAIDNFSHIGGFIMGILTSLLLMPTINFSKIHKRFNWLLRILALPIVVLLFFFLIRNFYTQDDPASSCPWCKYLSCLPVAGWCDISGIQVTNTP